jgi:hypothetical protein
LKREERENRVSESLGGRSGIHKDCAHVEWKIILGIIA